LVRKLALIGLVLLFGVPASAATPRILPPQDAWPTWSPDGNAIAFTRIHEAGNLMELDLLDLRTHRITKLAQGPYQPQPSWSPDGSQIAYQSGGSVYVTDVHGRKRRIGLGGAPAYGPALARTKGGSLYVGRAVWAAAVIGRPAWSPDGSTIAFRRDDGIYTTEGPGKVRLLVGGANPGDPVWSRDGAQIAFTIRDEVWVASRGLVPAHAIARAKPGAGTPSWSRAGDAVVYTWRSGVGLTYLNGRSSLLARTSGLGAAFSPRADVVAFAGGRRDCPGHLAIRIYQDNVFNGAVTGSCAIRGTAGGDVIEGSLREGDVILAGAGNDKIHANDGHTDRVDCGPGRDTVWADRTDRLAHCEIVHR
jgi:dipeptidyl aminopeptidase/acylaminoacyl peptidase